MNRLAFKTFLLIILHLAFSRQGSAQKLRFLIPDGVIVQHAGSIGYFSGGINYDLFNNHKGSLDVMFGVVPESKGGGFTTLNTKFAYRPFEIKINDWLIVHPLNPGAFFSYTLDKDFDLTWDKGQYLKGYYYWSEALHFHISFGSEIKLLTTGLRASTKVKSLTFYYEVNTNEMYIVNYVQNKKALSVTDIFKAGIGIKASF
jgi:hypothetical protein